MPTEINWNKGGAIGTRARRWIAVGMLCMTIGTLAGCTSRGSAAKPAADNEPKSDSFAPRPGIDTWQRQKDCLAIVQKTIENEFGSLKNDPGVKIMGWTNHYSPKYGHCYVQLSYVLHGENRISLENLMDPLENYRSLAESATGNWGCTIGSDKVDCKQAAAFIEDHMGN